MLSSLHRRLIYSLKFWSICIFFMKFFRIISLPTMVSLSSIYFVTLTTSCLIFHYDKIKQDSSETNSFLLPAVSTKSWTFPHYRKFKLKLKWLENGAEIQYSFCFLQNISMSCKKCVVYLVFFSLSLKKLSLILI